MFGRKRDRDGNAAEEAVRAHRVRMFAAGLTSLPLTLRCMMDPNDTLSVQRYGPKGCDASYVLLTVETADGPALFYMRADAVRSLAAGLMDLADEIDPPATTPLTAEEREALASLLSEEEAD